MRCCQVRVRPMVSPRSALPVDRTSRLTKAVPQGTSATSGGACEDHLVDPLAPELPTVRLPSVFKPGSFKEATRARGARPAALKEIDAQLAELDRAAGNRERFDHLKRLQVSLSDFLMRYSNKNNRRKAASDLKRWVDGAVDLRAPVFDDFGKRD